MTKTPEELTWDWKAGKLPCDDDNHEWLAYYIKQKDGFIHADSYWRGQWGTADRNSIVEVLAPVPTYDEYKAMRAELAEHRHYCCCNENEVMRLKLAELEELLRECQAHLSLGEIGTSVTPLNILLTHINAALGDMLKNPENFNTPDENVKGDDR